MVAMTWLFIASLLLADSPPAFDLNDGIQAWTATNYLPPRLATATESGIDVFALPKGDKIVHLAHGEVRQLAFAHYDRYLTALSKTGEFAVWDTENWKVLTQASLVSPEVAATASLRCAKSGTTAAIELGQILKVISLPDIGELGEINFLRDIEDFDVSEKYVVIATRDRVHGILTKGLRRLWRRKHECHNVCLADSAPVVIVDGEWGCEFCSMATGKRQGLIAMPDDMVVEGGPNILGWGITPRFGTYDMASVREGRAVFRVGIDVLAIGSPANPRKVLQHEQSRIEWAHSYRVCGDRYIIDVQYGRGDHGKPESVSVIDIQNMQLVDNNSFRLKRAVPE